VVFCQKIKLCDIFLFALLQRNFAEFINTLDMVALLNIFAR